MLLLLDRGADINMVTRPLTTAVRENNTDIVSLLLGRGADINLVIDTSNGTESALTVAVKGGRTDVASLLLDQGANINIVGGKYGTALAAATFAGNRDMVWYLLRRGANINAMGGDCGTALGAAVFTQREDIVSLLVGKGADMNLVTSKFGTVLGQAISKRSIEIALLLLEHGADVLRVGGSYSTTSSVYPSALDVVAHSEGNSTNPNELQRVKNAIVKRQNQQANLDADPVNDVISRPPFPMSYTGLYSMLGTSPPKSPLPSSLLNCFDILSTESHANDGNITSKQADVLFKDLNEDVLWRSLAALVGLNEETTQAKHQWIQNDVRYFIACNFDFGLAYAAARVAWKRFNEPSEDSCAISIRRGQWHKDAQVLGEARSR